MDAPFHGPDYKALHNGLRVRTTGALCMSPDRGEPRGFAARAMALIHRIVADAAYGDMVPVAVRRSHVTRADATMEWLVEGTSVPVPRRTAEYPLKTALSHVYGKAQRNCCVAFAFIPPHDARRHVSTTRHACVKSKFTADMWTMLNAVGAKTYGGLWVNRRDGTDDWPGTKPVGYVLYLHFRFDPRRASALRDELRLRPLSAPPVRESAATTAPAPAASVTPVGGEPASAAPKRKIKVAVNAARVL